MRPSVTILAAIAALATTAAPAAANTLSYSGTTGSSDSVLPGFIPTDANGPTSCGSTVNENAVPLSINPRFRQYAFRNLSSSSDCITVSGTSPGCPTAGEETGDVTFSANLTHLLGSDDPDNINGCQVNHAHSFTAAPGQTFAELVFAGATGVP